MSHYSKTDELHIKGDAELVMALHHLGFTVLEQHATPQPLHGYQGDRRAQRAHVIIRRSHTGLAASNDVGFERNADGTWSAHISDYDARNKFSPAWVRGLIKECGVQRSIQTAKRLGHRVVRSTDAKGRPQLEVTGRW